jgi:hypothetical protein
LPKITWELNVNGIVFGTDRDYWRLQDVPGLERKLAGHIMEETAVAIRPACSACRFSSYVRCLNNTLPLTARSD